MATVAAKPRTGSAFFVLLTTAMGATVILGFWFTYFEPLFQRSYPSVSPLVHVHGWSFFVWYGLLFAQAWLIRKRSVPLHEVMGWARLGLALVMIVVGLIVTTMRIDQALEPGGSPFWKFMGLPIFSIWMLFSVY